MPGLVKFGILAGGISLLGYVGLYVLAVHFEPAQEEVSKSVPSITIKR